MRIEESFTVSVPIASAWEAIRNPEIVAPCIPGCESIEVVDPTHYKAAVRLGLGPIKLRFLVEVEITEEEAPIRLVSTTKGEEGGRASRVRSQNVLSLTALGDRETEIAYSAEVEVTGRIAKFGFGMMKKKAETLGREFAEAFRKRVENGQDAA
ncbi:MAG TPA: SRPBCC domain-containing protein [Alphaproteobacteria bacterium]|nr:SRPBCC domain-containing protein [Alphaproteobacteria bacterium]